MRARNLGWIVALVAACSIEASLFSGGEDAGQDDDAQGGSAGEGGRKTTATTATSGPIGGQGGEGGTAGTPSPGGMGGEGGSGGGHEKFECQLSQGCDEADPVACVCEGCNSSNPQCTNGEDCVCPDCADANGCMGCEGPPDGQCHPYYEGCTCEDCALHPLCF